MRPLGFHKRKSPESIESTGIARCEIHLRQIEEQPLPEGWQGLGLYLRREFQVLRQMASGVMPVWICDRAKLRGRARTDHTERGWIRRVQGTCEFHT